MFRTEQRRVQEDVDQRIKEFRALTQAVPVTPVEAGAGATAELAPAQGVLGGSAAGPSAAAAAAGTWNPATVDTMVSFTKANAKFGEELYIRLAQGHVTIAHHQRRMRLSYLIYLAMAVIMFLLGLALVAIPVIPALKGHPPGTLDYVAGGVGAADLVILLLASPFTRIHKMMGDMTQLTLLVEGFLYQVGLRMMAMDGRDRATLNDAARHVGEAAKETSRLIQRYFEPSEAATSVLGRVGQTLAGRPNKVPVREVMEKLREVEGLLERLPKAPVSRGGVQVAGVEVGLPAGEGVSALGKPARRATGRPSS